MEATETETIKHLRNFLEQLASFCKQKNESIYGLALENGKSFNNIRSVKSLFGYPKACYCNCYEIAKQNPEKYVYCEGFAVQSDLFVPVTHAWLHDLELGYSVDPTWDISDDAIAVGIGFMFKLDYVEERLKECDQYGIIENLHKDKDRNKILKSGFSYDVLFN